MNTGVLTGLEVIAKSLLERELYTRLCGNTLKPVRPVRSLAIWCFDRPDDRFPDEAYPPRLMKKVNREVKPSR